MGFIPNVQFAPYYVAFARGYYAAEGLAVELNHERTPEALQLLAGGKFDFAVTSGDAMVPAVVRGIPVVYIMRQYTKYPVGALALSDPARPLKSPADLRGRKVGISAPAGPTFNALKALQQAAHLTDADMQVIIVGFTEVEALTQHRIDVAMTYLTNEPVAMRGRGTPIDVLNVSPYVDLVSTGLATNRNLIKEHPDLVRGFVRATLRGLKDTLADPDAAFDITLKRMPETTGDDVKVARAKLTTTLEYEQPAAGHPLGWSDPAAWQTTVDFLKSVGVIDTLPDPATLFTNQWIEQAGQ
ncbi:MAG: ABC transporter substrate-binding protein [Herpetosiphon sp.]